MRSPSLSISLTFTRASRDTMVTRTSGRARHSSAAAAEAAMPEPTMTTAADGGRGGEGVSGGEGDEGGAVVAAAGVVMVWLGGAGSLSPSLRGWAGRAFFGVCGGRTIKKKRRGAKREKNRRVHF
jgi:hypothetical protein